MIKVKQLIGRDLIWPDINTTGFFYDSVDGNQTRKINGGKSGNYGITDAMVSNRHGVGSDVVWIEVQDETGHLYAPLYPQFKFSDGSPIAIDPADVALLAKKTSWNPADIGGSIVKSLEKYMIGTAVIAGLIIIILYLRKKS